MRLYCLFVVAGTLLGCTSTPAKIDMPALIYGKISAPLHTDWIRDYCQAGRPVTYANLLVSRDCLTHGGEISAAKLNRVRVVDGPRVSGSFKVAFVGHALKQSYSEALHVVLVPSPPDFRAATGIAYFVGDRDNFDVKNKCINNNGYSHLDFNACPDPEFHETHAGCIGVSEYLAHYAKSP